MEGRNFCSCKTIIEFFIALFKNFINQKRGKSLTKLRNNTFLFYIEFFFYRGDYESSKSCNNDDNDNTIFKFTTECGTK